MDVEDVVTKKTRYIMDPPADKIPDDCKNDLTSEITIERPSPAEDSPSPAESYDDQDKSASEIEEECEDIEEEVLDLSTKKHNGNGNVNYFVNNNVRASGFTGDKEEDMDYDSDRSDELHIVENEFQADNDSECDDESKDLQSSASNMLTSPKFYSKEQEEYLKQLLRNHMRNYPVSQSQPQVPQQSRIGNTHKFVNMNNSTIRDFTETEIRSRASSHQSNFVPQIQAQRTQKDSRVCANCSTDQTSLWRRTEDGQTVCNACGMYFRFHGRKRPLTLCASNNKILRRRRRRKDDNNTKKSSTTTSTAIQSSKALVNILPKKENGNGEILKTLLIFGSSNDQKESTTLGYNLNNNNAKDSNSTPSLDMSQTSPTSSLDDNDSYSPLPLVIDNNKFQHDRPSNNKNSNRNNNRNHVIIKTEIQKSDQTSEEEEEVEEYEYILPDLKVEKN